MARKVGRRGACQPRARSAREKAIVAELIPAQTRATKAYLLRTLFGVALRLDASGAPDAPAMLASPAPPAVRLKFNSYNGDPSHLPEMTFQSNMLDLRQPARFLKIGDVVPYTRLKLQKFADKIEKDAGTGGERDILELFLVDAQTGGHFELPLNKVMTIPGGLRPRAA